MSTASNIPQILTTKEQAYLKESPTLETLCRNIERFARCKPKAWAGLLRTSASFARFMYKLQKHQINIRETPIRHHVTLFRLSAMTALEHIVEEFKQSKHSQESIRELEEIASEFQLYFQHELKFAFNFSEHHRSLRA